MSPHVEKLSWQEAMPWIKSANSYLLDIIQAWDPPKDYVIYKFEYPFGVDVIDKGVLQVPVENNKVVPIHDDRVPSDVKKHLTYSHVPLGLLVENGHEVYHESQGIVTPLSFFNPGFFLGLWESLEKPMGFAPKSTWSVSSGARSLYMAPKISLHNAHQKLKKAYGVKGPPPKTLYDHHQIFKQLVHAEDTKAPWKHVVLFFSDQWLQRDDKNPGWLRFHHYLLELAWELSGYSRNKLSYDRIWQLFIKVLEKKGVKSPPYLVTTLRQLIGIGVGASSGFRAVHDTNLPGPIQQIQSIYLNDYGLKKYIPTIMAPGQFSPHNNSDPIYYSLQVPLFFDLLPRNKTPCSLMHELRELKSLMDYFINEALDGNLNIEQTPIEWFVDNVAVDFFHSDEDIYEEIRRASMMPEEDPNLLGISNGLSTNGSFAENSPFFRACVRLSLINAS